MKPARMQTYHYVRCGKHRAESMTIFIKVSVPTIKLAFYIHINYPPTAAIHDKFIFIVDLPLILGRPCVACEMTFIYTERYI